MLSLGLNFLGFNPARTEKHAAKTNNSHFERAFGANTEACCSIYRDIQVLDIGSATIHKPKPDHFLLALHWLRRYPTEEANAGMSGLHEDTVRKWAWKYCAAIQALKVYKVRLFMNQFWWFSFEKYLTILLLLF